MLDPKFKARAEKETADYVVFILEPLEEGYGHTLGNALRRVLLTSLPGAAVTSVKIEGIKHQFSTLEGLKEDIVELILNIKKIRLKFYGDKPIKLRLFVKGPKEIKAGDIETPPEAEIVNKDLPLGTLADKKAKLEVEMRAERGYGYSLAEERRTGTIGVIPLDATFTPVTRVNYKVEATRVGRLTNLDRLILEIWTDATLSPHEALKEAAKILVSHFLQIYEPKTLPEKTEIEGIPPLPEEILRITFEELELPTRTVNSLKNGGIETIRQFLNISPKDLAKIKNLGPKSFSIIEEKLKEKGVKLEK